MRRKQTWKSKFAEIFNRRATSQTQQAVVNLIKLLVERKVELDLAQTPLGKKPVDQLTEREALGFIDADRVRLQLTLASSHSLNPSEISRYVETRGTLTRGMR